MTRRSQDLLALGMMLAATPAWAAGTERVSVGLNGAQPNDSSLEADVSGTGRFVAFRSVATNLVPNDTNQTNDIFVRDRETGTITRVSVGPSGVQGNGSSDNPPVISDGGRFVVFTSEASNLVAGDTNGKEDIFLHDRQTGTTSRVSVGSNGVQANENSAAPAISGDGNFVAFYSFATNLVPGDTNGHPDIFVHDRKAGTTTRVNLGPNGAEANNQSIAPAISADGRFVAFSSLASNLVTGDTNDAGNDIFVRDRKTGTTTRVNLGPNGVQANRTSYPADISANGQFVAFYSDATNLVSGDTNRSPDVFVRDRKAGKTTRVSVGPKGRQGNRGGFEASISADGRFVAFASTSTNLVSGDKNGDSDIFVHDRKAGTTKRVNLGPGGAEFKGDGSGVSSPAISADGRFVAYFAFDANLVPGDSNDFFDVFLSPR